MQKFMKFKKFFSKLIITTTFLFFIICISASIPDLVRIDLRSANKNNNGIWLGPCWVYKIPDIKELLDNLSKNQIYRLYFNLGNIKTAYNSKYKFNIYFNDAVIDLNTEDMEVKNFKDLIKFKKAINNYNIKNNTNFKLIGVINGEEKYKLLESEGFDKNELINLIVNILYCFNSKELILNGKHLFDGYQLDIEPISNANNLNNIINEVKMNLNNDQFLSVVIGKDDLKSLNKIANSNLSGNDELALMAYNYNLENSDAYIRAVANQTFELVNTLAVKDIDSSLYIPLYPESKFHDPDIENVKNCLTGIMITANDKTVYKNFSRIIIYNYDELKDKAEWNQSFYYFKKLWLGK